MKKRFAILIAGFFVLAGVGLLALCAGWITVWSPPVYDPHVVAQNIGLVIPPGATDIEADQKAIFVYVAWVAFTLDESEVDEFLSSDARLPARERFTNYGGDMIDIIEEQVSTSGGDLATVAYARTEGDVMGSNVKVVWTVSIGLAPLPDDRVRVIVIFTEENMSLDTGTRR